MKEKIEKGFIFICLLILFLPLLLVIIRVKVDDRFSSEKINGNFEKNFPLKDDYFSIYFYIKSEIFDVNPIPDKVIDLKNGWLFCGDNFGDNLSESKGLKKFSKNEVDTLKSNILKKEKWLKKNNIQYYIAVAPNKESIYGNLISINKRKSILTKREQIDSLCKKINTNYIDLSSNFPKNGKILFFHKTDTHWNEYAGFFGYLSIINQIKLKNPNQNITPLNINNFYIAQSDVIIGDLREMLRLVKTEKLVVMNYKKPNSPKSWMLKANLVAPEGYENDPSIYARRFGSKSNKLKIMLLTDSFGGYMVKFLKENFGESVFIWGHTFNKEMIDKEKPDIIIQEFVERNVDFLLDKKN
jgi:alginate O-acetyltransferase complex protein AlgJ